MDLHEYDTDEVDTRKIFITKDYIALELFFKNNQFSNLTFYYGEGQDQQLTDLFLEKIRSQNFMEFETLLIKTIQRYESALLIADHCEQDPKQMIQSIEIDISSIYEHQKTIFTQEQILFQEHGIVQFTYTGYYVYFYCDAISYMSIEDQNINQVLTQGYEKLIGARIDIEMSESLYPIPIVPQVESFSEDGSIMFTQQVGDNVPVVFVLIMNEKLPISFNALVDILSLGIGKNDQISPDTMKNSLSNLLIPSLENPVKCQKFIKNMSQIYQEYGPTSPGTYITRIPLIHVSRLKPILDILRQQCTYNELFLSCFSDNPLAPNVNTRKRKRNEEEQNYVIETILRNAPYSIDLNIITPEEKILGIKIDIALGGTISTQYHGDISISKCPQEKLSSILQTCKSIPVSLTYCFE
eukprot:TRINITY_DN8857_c0_g1_i1.p1 TRINITY_DN8857_c0_g1~~TRINITY_DN8857_c0_g1_i1.p1  ORF type:complete len:412 (-),score=72.44 TRINITY_DN8857_c0_g1_i1:8-1243(-)